MATDKEIFFHCGLGKTGTKYVQYKFFPKLKGLDYIQRTSYKKYAKIVPTLKSDKVLISNEMDRQLEPHMQKMAEHYPNVKVIVVLRRNDSWLASQYRRQVKNGKCPTFTEFIDIDNNTGYYNVEDAYMMNYLKIIEKYTTEKPLILFHSDLVSNPEFFFDQIAAYTGSSYNMNVIDLAPKHTSYEEKQLKVMMKWGKNIFNQNRPHIENYYLRKLRLYRLMIARYSILYSAGLVPNSWLGEQPLINRHELDRVRDFYAEDWKEAVAYAKANNDSLNLNL